MPLRHSAEAARRNMVDLPGVTVALTSPLHQMCPSKHTRDARGTDLASVIGPATLAALRRTWGAMQLDADPG